MLHGHGDDGYRFKNKIIANFSTNIWYGGHSHQLKKHLIANWDIINSYPESAAESLVTTLSDDLNIPTDQIIATNGATEAFYLIAQCYAQKSSTIVIPTFAEYEDACNINSHEIIYIDWKYFTKHTIVNTDLVWICNPNNPTGSVMNEADLKQLINNNREAVFVIDEAYIDFTDTIHSIKDWVKEYDNLIVVKSLTKNFAIPGLRLAYLVASKALASNIRFYKPPWSVNALAIEAGKYLLAHKEEILPNLNIYKTNKNKLVKSLQQIRGIKIYDSETSFFLIELEKGTALELKNYLISRFGILIRDASNFRGLNQSFIRIATLSETKNQLLIDALKIWSNLNM